MGFKDCISLVLSARVVSSEDEENVHDEDMFSVNDLDGDEVVVESEVADKDVNLISAASTKVSTVIPTNVATIITVVSLRPRAKGIVFHEQEKAPTLIVSSQNPSQIKVQDNGKGKMNEPEPVKKLSKNDQLGLNEELAFRLQAEEEEESSLQQKELKLKGTNHQLKLNKES
ncbi:hypothetical protein Tco_0124851, partial [Tanacetum coccineum]